MFLFFNKLYLFLYRTHVIQIKWRIPIGTHLTGWVSYRDFLWAYLWNNRERKCGYCVFAIYRILTLCCALDCFVNEIIKAYKK